MSEAKPRVVCLGAPQYVGKDFVAEFSKKFEYHVLDATNRMDTQEKLPKFIEQHGPVDGFIIRMGTPPFEPFDEELLKALVPSCKIITSASAGFNEFDIEWMGKNGITFCNSVDAVAEATADMAIFLTLAVLKNASNAERSARARTWKQGLVPTKDPTGMILGIVGMGSIGKVSSLDVKSLTSRQEHHSLTTS